METKITRTSSADKTNFLTLANTKGNTVKSRRLARLILEVRFVNINSIALRPARKLAFTLLLVRPVAQFVFPRDTLVARLQALHRVELNLEIRRRPGEQVDVARERGGGAERQAGADVGDDAAHGELREDEQDRRGGHLGAERDPGVERGTADFGRGEAVERVAVAADEERDGVVRARRRGRAE